MKIEKLLKLYVWLFILTPLIYFPLLVGINRIESAVYFQTHGTNEGNIGDCTGATITLVPFTLTIFCVIGLVWVYFIKKQILHLSNKSLAIIQQIQIILLTIFFAIPIAFISILMIYNLFVLSITYILIGA